MKKIIYIMLFLTVIATLVSCEGPAGRDGRDGFVNFRIVDLEVKSYQWQYTGYDNNNFFIAEFEMPEITKGIYDNGLVQVYREYGTGSANAVQLLLPSTRHNEYSYQMDGETYWGFYSETTDYEYGIGILNVFYTVSDFIYEEDSSFVPEDMHFRVVIMW